MKQTQQQKMRKPTPKQLHVTLVRSSKCRRRRGCTNDAAVSVLGHSESKGWHYVPSCEACAWPEIQAQAKARRDAEQQLPAPGEPKPKRRRNGVRVFA